jgi:NADH-quinone oxidoreductase subunit L
VKNLIFLIPFLPFLGFVINGLFGKKLSKTAVGLIGSGAVGLAFLLSLLCFNEIAARGQPLLATLYNWLTVSDFSVNFGFLVDQLSVWMMLIITGVGFLIHVYSIGYMHDDEGFWRFFAYLNLFVFSMLLLVMGDNFLVLFFGWEGVGLCSYLLIGFWYNNAEYGKAARKAFIMNRIGDLGLLLGIFLIFNTSGSVTYTEVFSKTSGISPEIITAICLLLFVGAMGKSAQIPLYTWLPDAMAGPTPVSALIHAATMVTAGIYMITRCNTLYSLSPDAMNVVAIVGVATCLFAAVIGLRQNDIKKVLAYSTVSQLGLMFVALGMGAYTSAMFHLTTHAFFKALLFLGAGSVIHAMGGEQDIRNMGGLRKHLPVTFLVFAVGTLAIMGFPLFSGFFSKDEIFANTYLAGGKLWWGLAGLGAMFTAIYMGRLFFVTFYGEFRGSESQRCHLHESPKVMTVPLIVLAILSVFGGFLNTPHLFHLPGSQWFASWLFPGVSFYLGETHIGTTAAPPPLIGQSLSTHLPESTEWTLMLFTTAMMLLVLATTWYLYAKKRSVPVADAAQSSLTCLIANKFYVDEIYDALFVKPVEKLSTGLHRFADVLLIDGIVNGVGAGVQAIGRQARKLQTGNIEFYLLGMVVGIVAVVLAMIL